MWWLKIVHRWCCLKKKFFIKKNSFQSPANIFEMSLVVIIPSYNNSRYCERNIASVLEQNYTNYRVMFINDRSTDNTLELVRNYCAQHDRNKKITIHNNSERLYRLGNLYWAVHTCEDNEIIVELDGDDYFAHPNVLAHINDEYARTRALMLHANYINCPPDLARSLKLETFSQRTPSIVMRKRLFRHYPWIYSGTRSYYAWLFKRIKRDDLICATEPFAGQIFPLCDDLAIMLPMLEMAAPRVGYITEPVLLRNIDSPINDFKQYDHDFRARVRVQLLSRRVYEPINVD